MSESRLLICTNCLAPDFTRRQLLFAKLHRTPAKGVWHESRKHGITARKRVVQRANRLKIFCTLVLQSIKSISLSKFKLFPVKRSCRSSEEHRFHIFGWPAFVGGWVFPWRKESRIIEAVLSSSSTRCAVRGSITLLRPFLAFQASYRRASLLLLLVEKLRCHRRTNRSSETGYRLPVQRTVVCCWYRGECCCCSVRGCGPGTLMMLAFDDVIAPSCRQLINHHYHYC